MRRAGILGTPARIFPARSVVNCAPKGPRFSVAVRDSGGLPRDGPECGRSGRDIVARAVMFEPGGVFMSGRVESLHALAWSLPDVQPGPASQGSFGTRGEAPGGWELCGKCDGNGSSSDRFGRAVVCGECGGAGRYRVDSFTGLRVSAVDSHAPGRSRRVVCDRCGGSGVMLGRYVGEQGLVRCRGCDGAGSCSVLLEQREPVGVAFDGSELSRTRETGDWGFLEAALAAFAMAYRQEWRLWVRVRVGGEPVASPYESVRLSWSDGHLLEGLPNPLRCPRWAREGFVQRAKRGDAREAARRVRVFEARGSRSHKRFRARELVQLGYSLSEAAELAGCSIRTAQRAVAA